MATQRDLPQVDALAKAPELSSFPGQVRLDAAREAIDRLRSQIADDNSKDELHKQAVTLAKEIADSKMSPSLAQVINASGVILHTGLGRARLADEAVAQAHEAAAHHSNLELDLATGKRGDRQQHVRALLQELTGAEDVFVVNNCAAAVFLTLHALARRREVILSRGQMVEIGGSFRLPDIVRQSGCKLVEIGTTNRTRLSDYEQAITPKTGALLRCHPSNFKVVGFTEEPRLDELSHLAKRSGVPLIEDAGAGCIFDTAQYGLPEERTLRHNISDGADIVTASGDKLLGGPQAGLILGRADLVQRIRKDSLARVVRIDKLSLAALEATLRLHRNGEAQKIPTIHYLSRSLSEVKADAEALQQAYRGKAVVVEGITEVGGGSLPGVGVPTFRLGLKVESANQTAAILRSASPPVIARIEKDIVWLDPRTINPQELEILKNILRNLPC